MGFRMRKSIKIAPGVKVNLNKKSASVTFGGKGLHHTISSTGKKTTTVGVPGTGISYSKTSGGNQKAASAPSSSQHNSASFSNSPQQNNKKWYEKAGWIIFFLIFFFPIGLFLMWKSNWKKVPKIVISAFYAIAIIVYFMSPKLESITISADTELVYDINSEIPIEVSVVPENYSLSESSFNISGGEIVEKDESFVFVPSKTGEYTVNAEMNGIESNELSFQVEDKTAIAKAKAEQEAEERRIQAEQEAAAQAEAEKIKAEQETTAQVETQQEEMVWIPQSGGKYHSKPNCSGMNNPREVTLSEAQSLGLEPCKRCH